MIDIKTYQDLEKAIAAGERDQFVFRAIQAHTGSEEYQQAQEAKLYAEGKNATISKYQKLLYKLSGEAIPDNFAANHKCKSGIFHRAITQEASFLLKNGVIWKKKETKKKLGKKFDTSLYWAVKDALTQGAAYGFWNRDHVKFYSFLDFVPLPDEETSALRAGISFSRVAPGKPLNAILFEADGYTKYRKPDNGEIEIVQDKRAYVLTVSETPADGVEITGAGNYPGFPIIPLWGNHEHQSELVGKQEQIDCHDLIKSGFANDLDEASVFYWTLKNCGGMDDDTALAKFVERMKILHASTVGSGDGMDGEPSAEAHTMEVPYQSREVYLTRLEKDMYKDFMMLDVENIASGAVTATQIQAAYEPLSQKAAELQKCLEDFFEELLEIAGIDDEPSFKPSMIVNQSEVTQMVLSAGTVLDDETIIKQLPFLTDDQVDEVMARKADEESSRYKLLEKQLQQAQQQQNQMQAQQQPGGGSEE